jgi:hypothetical protein
MKSKRGEKMEIDAKEFERQFALKGKISAVLGIGWVAFLISWLFLFASDFDVYKNIAIVVGSLIGVFALMGVTWMWGVKFPEGCKNAMKEVKGLGSRMLISMITMITSVAFFLVWFYFYALNYSAYVNLGVLIVQILATFGVLGIAWRNFKIEGIEGKEEGNGFNCKEMFEEFMKNNEESPDTEVA